MTLNAIITARVTVKKKDSLGRRGGARGAHFSDFKKALIMKTTTVINNSNPGCQPLTPASGKPASGNRHVAAPVILAGPGPSTGLCQEVKRLQQKQRLALAKATVQEWDLAHVQLLPMSPHDPDPESLKRKLALGQLFTDTLSLDNVPAFVIFWHVESRTKGTSAVCVNGVASLLHSEDRWDLLMDGLDLLAKQNGCHEIIFHSFRAGVAEMATKSGYEAVSVCYRKVIRQENSLASIPSPAPGGGKPAREAAVAVTAKHAADDKRDGRAAAVENGKGNDEAKCTIWP